MSNVQFEAVTAQAVANVYFDGKVVSHTILFADGTKKTLGLIFQGSFRFDTGAPEIMQMTAGTARVRIAGETGFKTYEAGQSFNVPANSSFEIAVDSGIAQYVCHFG
ncbi:MAG TPA: pyrimidine/purine nucleoside phosphorylase [Polyangiaceae bacterium]|nr:pyrimidine/purine nucleoside phosphorylase [Polyangiaceae bacterium]